MGGIVARAMAEMGYRGAGTIEAGSVALLADAVHNVGDAATAVPLLTWTRGRSSITRRPSVARASMRGLVGRRYP